MMLEEQGGVGDVDCSYAGVSWKYDARRTFTEYLAAKFSGEESGREVRGTEKLW